ncbi:MAG: alpha-galactosidase [Lachnospiraceae bacterium]|nr:alpha-galactosidase [Lachnospiraceae bacterium]
MTELISKFELGDMQALYFSDKERENAELLLLPAGMEYIDKITDIWHDHSDSVVQIKLAGDMYTGAYSPGVSMRNDTKFCPFKYVNQKVYDKSSNKEIVTLLQDKRGLLAEHHLVYSKGDKALRSRSVFKNHSDSKVSLELLSSFSLGRISPMTVNDSHDTIRLHRIRSVWSMEGRKEIIPLENLQLEPSWGGHAVRCERFGSVGSYAVNKFFPFMAVEDSAHHVFWGASIAHNASWQMEVYRRGMDVQISGGLADREFGHWMKDVRQGEEFETPEAYISVCHTEDEEEIFRRLTSMQEAALKKIPESEQSLPILFNEYCTTWGNPSHENISEIVNTVRGKGFEYFVIDCGWYKRPEVPWDISMGDYEVSKELFPKGLEKTVELIKNAGMKPGIWFEIDNVGSESKAYQDTGHLLKRDGKVLTTTMRRFWDLRQAEVRDYLNERVIGTLKKYGFEYLKIDCNDTIGIGCDGAESMGEGLRQNQAASIDFIDSIRNEIPGIIIENCASGGHKLEPLMMSRCSMASFSDAHECEEIPIIAANLHRTILPRQSQIWAVIRKEDGDKRIVYSIVNTFLGRMCISGDAWLLNNRQWKLIDDGIAFYKKISPIIKSGRTYFYGPKIKSYRHPEGWQGIFREDMEKNKAYITLHGFNNAVGKEIEMRIPCGYKINDIYSYENEIVSIDDGKLRYCFKDDMSALGLYLEKE